MRRRLEHSEEDEEAALRAEYADSDDIDEGASTRHVSEWPPQRASEVSPSAAPPASAEPSATGQADGSALGKVITVFAGITTLALVMGFPAVAWQFRGFGVPLELAPERSFLIAGALPTGIVVLALSAARRLPRIRIGSEKPASGWAMFQTIAAAGPFSMPLMLGWIALSVGWMLTYAAMARLCGDLLCSWLGFRSVSSLEALFAGLLALGAFALAVRRLRQRPRFVYVFMAVNLAATAFVMHRGGGPWWPAPVLAACALVLPLAFMAAVKLWPAKFLSGVVFGVPIGTGAPWLMFALMQLATVVIACLASGPLVGEVTRDALVVLGLLPRTTPHALWVLGGVIWGLLAAHSQVLLVTGLLFNSGEATSSYSAKLLFGPDASVSKLETRIAHGSYLVLAACLVLIQALGMYPRLSRPFLGGKPACVAGVIDATLPAAAARRYGLKPVAEGRAFEFDRLCVLVATADDVALCKSDEPPSACLVLRRDDVASLSTAAQ